MFDSVDVVYIEVEDFEEGDSLEEDGSDDLGEEVVSWAARVHLEPRVLADRCGDEVVNLGGLDNLLVNLRTDHRSERPPCALVRGHGPDRRTRNPASD